MCFLISMEKQLLQDLSEQPIFRAIGTTVVQLVQLVHSWYTVGTKIATVAKDYNSGTDQFFMSWESPPSRVFAFMRLGQLCGRSHLIISFLIFCTVWLRYIQKKIGLQKQNRSKAQNCKQIISTKSFALVKFPSLICLVQIVHTKKETKP